MVGRWLRWRRGPPGIFVIGSSLVCFKIAGQIRYGMYTQLLCLSTAHHQGIGIVETDGLQPLEVIYCFELTADIIIHTIPVTSQPLALHSRRVENRQECSTG